MWCDADRYWKPSSSLEQLKNWLSDHSVISVYQPDTGTDENEPEESEYNHGAINVLCGDLMCKFGLKTFYYAGYKKPFASTPV